MPAAKRAIYAEQQFDHLRDLDAISDGQIAEHLDLYTGYVRQVNVLNEELATLRERGQRLTNHWVSLHQDGVPAGFKPLLVMDVWEHAFMRDYRATERARYLDAFFRNVDWHMIERRLTEPMAIRPAAAA